jgi:hypothetical protein
MRDRAAVSPAPSRSSSLVWLIALLAITNLLVAMFARFAASHGMQSELLDSLEISRTMMREHRLPPNAFYPPGLPILLAGLQWVGLRAINPILFGGVMLNAGVVLFFFVARRVLERPVLAFLAVFAMVVHPMFATTTMTRDFPTEFALSGLYFLLLLRSLAGPRTRGQAIGLGIALVLTAGALLLVRTTAFFVALAVPVVAWLVQPTRRRFLAGVTAGVLAVGLLYCAYNQRLVGSFTLGTSSGVNLYFGNHPLYIEGHPHYDIDGFFGQERWPNEKRIAHADSLPEAQAEAWHRARAMDFIRHDPIGFVYRAIVKSLWHWFNVEKIPNYAFGAYLRGDSDTIVLGPHSNLSGAVAYMMYKLAYLPFFVLAMVWWAQRRLEPSLAVFFAPYLALWPVLVMTYPDTRYKLIAEVIACIPITAAAWEAWRGIAAKRTAREV